jgi:phosphotransferase system enzyme I (PtsI)
MGPAFLLNENSSLRIIKSKISSVKSEINQFKKALSIAQNKTLDLKQKMINFLSKEEIKIYDAHVEILKDPELEGKTIDFIKSNSCNADYAVHKVTAEYTEILNEIGDPYISARADDIIMLSRMLILILQKKVENKITLNTPSIIVADSITTNQLSSIDTNLVLGIISSHGGPTDHVAILSKALGIPSLVGLAKSISKIKAGSLLIIDCAKAQLILNPSIFYIKKYDLLMLKEKHESSIQLKKSQNKVTTKSGTSIEINANIGSLNDAKKAKSFGADGIGLFRTELCFLDSEKFPDENMHYSTYESILKEFPEVKHTIRLLDFGSDKPLSYLNNIKEENPALGSRALRLGFKHYDNLLKPQIRALLRLSNLFNIHILCPMIASEEDWIQIKETIILEFNQLNNEGVRIDYLPRIGIMVEIPNVAFRPEFYIKNADFFSFGTNDLAQFLMAADRTNESVSNYLFQSKESILILIKNFTELAHKEGKEVGVCGELASDDKCLSYFLNININSLSMPPSLIPKIKNEIRNTI